jgi:MscS family membrane protein
MGYQLMQVVIPESAIASGITGLKIVGGLLILLLVSTGMNRLIRTWLPAQWQTFYTQVIAPDERLLLVVVTATLGDLVWLNAPLNYWWYLGEIGLGLAVGAGLILLGSRLFYRLFDQYLLNTALQGNQKVNSELFLVLRIVANLLLVVVVVLIFAQVHQVNIIGLLTSLGVGGIAIAFAAQKTLEQILGGIVLFIDRPFVVDDYVGLPDGTFGRVESIGLRSTKIRSSGKGTLVIIPNSNLAGANIENFTSIKKVISVFALSFKRRLSDDEKALVRQMIFESTQDILGIDPRSTEVSFTETQTQSGSAITQGQIYFFILGSGSVSMELRQQVLEISRQNISRKLTEYGIDFVIEERRINVESPITI